MAFEGDVLTSCGLIQFNFSVSYAVVVSGVKFNPCGHLILNTGGLCGFYCHIAERKGYPRYMDESGYRRYLSENGKHEIRRQYVPLKEPDKAYAKVEELLSKSWSWWVLPHNCVSFVEEVLQAGGTTAGLYSNCPIFENFQ